MQTGIHSASHDELQEARKRALELELRNGDLARELAATASARDRYADLYISAPQGYLTLDSKGSIDEINLNAANLFGGEPGRMVRQPFSSFVQDEEVDGWQRHFKYAKQSGQQQSCTLTLRRLDGTVFLASLNSRFVEIGGAPAISIVLADISEQKRKEKENLEWRNEMAELRKIQIAAQTATAIAHELNQPLLAIATYSEAAVKLLQADRPDLEKIGKAIGGCERQAHRAGKTIHELLDFLSLKEIPAEAFDLNKVIGEIVAAARSEHELEFDSVLMLEEALPPVFANRVHVEKVLFNLLRNGIEAMHESGVDSPAITVTVCTKYDANSAQVTIRDNGPGVKAENLQQLFKPFFTTKAKGIGMGLAVSRTLIEANGGQLWIDTQEGPGATFHLTLPFAS
jgi:PAS domain S-box-containing protein